jgi:hypothetical protein
MNRHDRFGAAQAQELTRSGSIPSEARRIHLQLPTGANGVVAVPTSGSAAFHGGAAR